MSKRLRIDKMSAEDRHRLLSDLPAHLIEGSDGNTLQAVLSDLQFVDAKISYLDSGLSRLIEDYDLALSTNILKNKNTLESHLAFLRMHAQKLSNYDNLLFTLALNEGPPQVQSEARNLINEGIWRKSYFQLSPTWASDTTQTSPSEQIKLVEIQTRWDFDPTPIVDIAPDPLIGFFLKRLGEIQAINLNRSLLQSSSIQIRTLRPINLFCSNNGNYLFVLFDNQEADLYRLDYSEEELRKQSKLITVNYLLPEFDDPVAAFDDKYLWYQEADGNLVKFCLETMQIIQLYRIPLVTSVPGELSSIILLSQQCALIALRLNKDTYLISLDVDGSSKVLRSFHDKEIACVVKCGLYEVAISFTNRDLTIFDLSSQFEEVSMIELEEVPSCMTWTGNSLVWLSARGTFHLWDLRSNKATNIQLSESPSRFFRGKRLCLKEDGSFIGITAFTSILFRFSEQEKPITGTIRNIFAKKPEGESQLFAIYKQDNGVWLRYGEENSLHRVNDNPRFAYKSFFEFDGVNKILGTGNPNYLLDIRNLSVTPVNNLPPNLTSIAGNPGGGFWLTDGFGSIYFLEQNGTCTEIANVQLKRVSKSTIYSWDGFVLWVGVCEHSTKAGTDLINAAIFFSPKRGFRGELKQLGRRFFEVSDGLFQAATYHPANDILWLIWQSSSRYRMAAKVGYPLDFINNKETEIPISGIDHNLSKITISSDATGLYCLSENGNLFRLNAQTMQVQAVLSGNSPIEAMVNSFGHEEILYLALKSHSQVVTCKFIGEIS